MAAPKYKNFERLSLSRNFSNPYIQADENENENRGAQTKMHDSEKKYDGSKYEKLQKLSSLPPIKESPSISYGNHRPGYKRDSLIEMIVKNSAQKRETDPKQDD